MIFNAVNGTVPVNGTDMDYISFGSGKKALIFLPGLSDGLATVKGKALTMAYSYKMFFNLCTVYMFSRKNNMPEGYSIREMAADQAEAMHKLCIEKAYVAGVSEGGMIAQQLAIDYPELVEKLVIAVSASKANETVKSAVSQWIEYAEEGNHRKLMIDTAEKSYSDVKLAQVRKSYPVIGLVGKPADYKRFLVNANAILGFDVSDKISSISCPTLIIAGEKDKIAGVQASYEMNEKIAGSEIHVYPGLGHAAYEESSNFNWRILEFLKKE